MPIAWFLSAMVFQSWQWNEPASPILYGIVHAPWLPIYDETDLAFYRVYPAAVATLLVPSFLLSVLVERPVVRGILELDKGTCRRAVRKANLASYAGLLLFCMSWLGFTQLADPEISYEEIRGIKQSVEETVWSECIEDPERAPWVWISDQAWFGPPVYEIGLVSVLLEAERACFLESLEQLVKERGVGPLRVAFFQRREANGVLDYVRNDLHVMDGR